MTSEYNNTPKDDLILDILVWDLFGSSVLYGKMQSKFHNYSLRLNAESSRFFLAARIILLRSSQ